jgi:hypothetical protein
MDCDCEHTEQTTGEGRKTVVLRLGRLGKVLATWTDGLQRVMERTVDTRLGRNARSCGRSRLLNATV